jgi:hypothetical protein
MNRRAPAYTPLTAGSILSMDWKKSEWRSWEMEDGDEKEY